MLTFRLWWLHLCNLRPYTYPYRYLNVNRKIKKKRFKKKFVENYLGQFSIFQNLFTLGIINGSLAITKGPNFSISPVARTYLP